ncbi:MAG: hypothetical protein PHU44_18020 [Syntrophales bacterium]|nr:hypothetical protein [Syntrophales bacterium]
MRRLTIFMLLSLFLIVAPTLVWAEFYIGPYAGINFAGEMNPDFEFYGRSPGAPAQGLDPNRTIYATRHAKGISADPAAIIGGKIGYWFDRESVFGVKMPSWLKYLGFEIDISYNQLNWPSQRVKVEPLTQRYVIKNNAYALTTTFLFIGRYGFLKDSEVPFGRLQPYIGIGPVLLVSNQKLNIGNDFRATEADLGFAIEPGIRYMIRKHFSVNMAFRYKFIPNHMDVDDKIFDQAQKYRYIVMRTNYNLFDLIFGAAYHF